jgi:retron-type reverse transcriptase
MMTPLFSYENIYRQYLQCRRNKRNTINALRFEYDMEDNILRLREELESQTYKPSRSVCFMARKPKLREIFAADFRDRVVHHILVDYLERIWEPMFIFDSCACRKKKGVHFGVKRLQGFIRKVTKNGSRNAYFLQLDIENFFMNIDKDILFKFIADKVRDENVLWLAKTLIYHDCTTDYVLKGERHYLRKLAPQKSLFYTEGRKGLPIGNLTSQFFANLYLNVLDQFVKHRFKCRYYVRYCDDFVMLSKDRDRLLQWKTEIEGFLAELLKLCLNRKRQSLQPVSNGINVLGYIVRGNYLLVRKRVINNLRSKLADYEKHLIKHEPPYIKIVYDYHVLSRLMSTLSSYFGHFKLADSYRLQMSLMKRYDFLKRFFALSNGRFIRIYENARNFKALKYQYRYFKRRFYEDVLLFQVGSYFEFYDEKSDYDIACILRLKRIIKPGTRKIIYGFPVRFEKNCIDRLKILGRAITVMGEGDRNLTGIKTRVLKYRLVFS